MDSQTSKKAEELRRQVELRQQIASLQAQLADVPEPHQVKGASPKRKQPEQSVLAPATPSPKKKRKISHNGTSHEGHALQSLLQPQNTTNGGQKQLATKRLMPNPPTKTSSTFVAKLATLNSRSADNDSITDRISRSIGFVEKPPTAGPVRPLTDDGVFQDSGEIEGVKRDDRLALIEELVPGPYNHKPPFDDPYFEKYEPHSLIRLSSRNIPHDEFQDYLRGRYYLSPSKLYSVVRLLPNKQGYDVPVEGDWVTIAVVAERGPIRFSRAPVGLGVEDGPDKTHEGKKKVKSGDKKASEDSKPHGKKYVNLKLIDFGCRTRSSNSHSGGQATIRGDAYLSLLLFESDGFDTLTTDEASGRGQKIYKGGSKGAFETMAKLREGAVVALLNPRVLKPFQRSNGSPHPTNNILALTPESASSIAVIGYATDLGMCTVVQKDGKVCGKWVDKRTSDVCEWHVQTAVERRRAGRAEFSSGTSGMSMSAVSKKKSAYDPARQWGLKPEESGGVGATYIVAGHVISGSSDTKSMYVSETIGREAQAKASRVSAREADKALKALLEKDKDGMRAVLKAREVGVKEKEGSDQKKSKPSNTTEGKDGNGDNRPRRQQKNAYSADVIKKLGFDPTAKAGNKGDDAVKKKLESLSVAHSSKSIELGPRLGKLRSCVSAPSWSNKPSSSAQNVESGKNDESVVVLDSSDVE